MYLSGRRWRWQTQTLHIESSGKHDPLLFLSQVFLFCHSSIWSVTIHLSPLSSRNAASPAKKKSLRLLSSPLFIALFFSALRSHSSFHLFPLFILSKVRVSDLPYHIWNHHCWVKAVLSLKCQQETENRCVFSLMTMQFLSLSGWFWKCFWAQEVEEFRGACNPLIL